MKPCDMMRNQARRAMLCAIDKLQDGLDMVGRALHEARGKLAMDVEQAGEDMGSGVFVPCSHFASSEYSDEDLEETPCPVCGLYFLDV